MEPIAIIGIGCRFPGAENPQEFWELLCNGVDTISEIPHSRWEIEDYYDPNPETLGKMNTRYGGFLSQVDHFDASFFGILPREASAMDPQQRLLLEVAWEALEDAGQTKEQLSESQTGVFIGISTNEYSHVNANFMSKPDGYDITGNAFNIAAGRIAYAFNFRGPTLAVDTACSSSLVAVHLACQSLRLGEATMALAGGVNLILSPIGHLGLSQIRALSPDGRCKTFDASADGYVRSEGVGCIVLKPLSRAIADKDLIYGVIRGSAINHDGRSKGLTVPYGPAQETLIRQALNQAEVSPAEINYVELHGTGTSLGDPIEAAALGAILAEGRQPEDQCLVGSVKTNIGHLEPASGIAGLIKLALSLNHKLIPPTLHFQTPNPYIPFEKLPLKIQSELTPWPVTSTSAKAGISSFGFSGTNVHAILEEAPIHPETITPQQINFPHLLPLSAHSQEALKALIKTYYNFLTSQPVDETLLQNICYSASVRRTHHKERLPILVNSGVDLIEQLHTLSQDNSHDWDISLSSKRRRTPKIAFVFSGQGPQWWAMGRELLAQEPVFRRVIEECDRLILSVAHWSLYKELTADESKSRLNDTEIAQPALFALQVALTHLWQSWGIEPRAVVGHSLGEIAAAHIAGVLSLEEAIQLICCRGRIMQQATGNGKMAAIELPATDIEPLLSNFEGQLAIAAINSPTSTVVSGDATALQSFINLLQQQNTEVFCKLLPVNYAFHSHQMAEFQTQLVEQIDFLKPQKAEIPFFSTVTGKLDPGSELNAIYWGKNLRQTVCFAPAMEALITSGYTVFLEISPHPVLAGYITSSLRHLEKEGQVLFSLKRKEPERATLLNSLGKFYTLGYQINWQNLYPDNCRFVNLPTYPWQRERYWINETISKSQHPLTSIPTQSSWLNLLIEGKTQELTQELINSQQLTVQQQHLLPQLLDLLVTPQPPEQPSQKQPVKVVTVEERVLSLLAQTTGLKTCQLRLNMSLEKDLGLDSILLAQLMSGLLKLVPEDQKVAFTKQFSLRDLIQLPTLADIVNCLKPWVSQNCQDSSPSQETATLEQSILSLLAKTTGLKTHQINLDMSLEKDLGLDSILLAQLMSGLLKLLPEGQRGTFSQQFSLRELIQLPSLRHLIDYLKPWVSCHSVESTSNLTPLRAKTPTIGTQNVAILDSQLPLMITHWTLNSNSLFATVKLKGSFDPQLAHQSWKDLLKRHPMLRARFVIPQKATCFNDYQLEIIDAPIPPKIAVNDIRHLELEEKQQALAQQINHWLNYQWSLTDWPLHQFSVLRLEDSVYQLFLGNEHLIADGLSNHVIVREFLEIYRANACHEVPNLPPATDTTTYHHIVNALNTWSDPEEDRALVEYNNSQTNRSYYWNPTGKKAESMIPEFDNQKYCLTQEMTTQLIAKTREWRLPMHSLLLGAFLRAVVKLQSDDPFITIQIPTSGRVNPKIDASGVVSSFAQNLALSFDPPRQDEDWQTLLTRIHQEVQKYIANGLDRAQTLQMGTIFRDKITLEEGRLPAYNWSIFRDLLKSNLYFPYTGQTQIKTHYGPIQVIDYQAGGMNAVGTIDLLQELFDSRLHLFASYDRNTFEPSLIEALMREYIAQIQDLLLYVPQPQQIIKNQLLSVNNFHLKTSLQQIASEICHWTITEAEMSQDLEADLGIDSLERIRIVTRLEQVHGQVDRQSLLNCRALQEMLTILISSESAQSQQPIQKNKIPIQATLQEIASQICHWTITEAEMSQDLEADLGIDSLERIRIVTRLEQVHGQVDRQSLLNCRSLQEMAMLIT